MEELKEKLTDSVLDKKVKHLVENYLQSDFEGDFLYYVLKHTSYVDNNTYKVVRDYELLERVCNLLK